MTGNETQAAAKRASKKLTLDQHQRGLLKRFTREWVAPRWRDLLWALVLTGLLAATTGAHPMIIKASFDTLMKEVSAAAHCHHGMASLMDSCSIALVFLCGGLFIRRAR